MEQLTFGCCFLYLIQRKNSLLKALKDLLGYENIYPIAVSHLLTKEEICDSLLSVTSKIRLNIWFLQLNRLLLRSTRQSSVAQASIFKKVTDDVGSHQHTSHKMTAVPGSHLSRSAHQLDMFTYQSNIKQHLITIPVCFWFSPLPPPQDSPENPFDSTLLLAFLSLASYKNVWLQILNGHVLCSADTHTLSHIERRWPNQLTP